MASTHISVLRLHQDISDRDALRQEPIGPKSRVSATMPASSRSQLSLNIMIRMISSVRFYFQLYSPKNWEFRAICQLATSVFLKLWGVPPGEREHIENKRFKNN
ncbi:hypothetical protein TNCV_2498921 [Trichonephila clavipes]|nr:hypothetical protein TNCV_2498921 [Trichonephila clavipes]